MRNGSRLCPGLSAWCAPEAGFLATSVLLDSVAHADASDNDSLHTSLVEAAVGGGFLGTSGFKGPEALVTDASICPAAAAAEHSVMCSRTSSS